MHRESKAELTDRLRMEGRWETFKQRREGLKAQGVPAKQAWFQAAAEFPPTNGQVPAGSAPKVDLTPLKDKPAVSVLEASTWVFEHLDCDWITPADAPSAGAWSLLVWARSSMLARTVFYKTFGTKVLSPPQEAQRKVEDAADDHERELGKRLFGEEGPDPSEDAEADRAQQEALMNRLFGKSGAGNAVG